MNALTVSNDMSDGEIVKALRSINRIAKKLRDTRDVNYHKGKHGALNNISIQVRKLYDLKDKVINKLISENKLTVLGLHRQNINYFIGKTPIPTTNYLTYFDFSGFKFHRPSNPDEIAKYKVIGEIGIIKYNSYIDNSYNEKEAKKILFAFTK